jgi:hypothetical protein
MEEMTLMNPKMTSLSNLYMKEGKQSKQGWFCEPQIPYAHLSSPLVPI